MSTFNQQGQIVGTQINRSGGIDFGAGSNIQVGGDIIGRDLVIKKVYTVNDFSDPYEPAFQIAVCTSMEEVMKLGLKHLWKIETSSTYSDSKCTDLITGEVKMVSRYSFIPTPFIEEVELNTLLITSEEFTKEGY